MFCPVCKLEYRPGFTRCSDCDVPLVESLDGVSVHTNAPQGVAQNPDAAELLWTGTESSISGAIAEALDAANISYHERARDVGVLPGFRNQSMQSSFTRGTTTPPKRSSKIWDVSSKGRKQIQMRTWMRMPPDRRSHRALTGK